MCCGLLLAGPWQAAQAVPIVFQMASGNGTSDDAARFTAVLTQGSNDHQALLQLFTASGSGARISSLYLQDPNGAMARDAISNDPLVALSQTQVYEVVLADTGSNKIAVIKTLSSALGIGLPEAKALVDGAPAVIRTASTPDGNAALKQSLEDVGARVTLNNYQDPSVPPGTNVGVTTPGSAPTGFDVVLSSAGGNKIPVIKAVRDLTGLDLADAKKLVDDAPSVIRANVSRADAIAMRQTLQDSGATVELQAIYTGTAGHGPIVLPPGSTGLLPDIALGFAYEDPDATPTLQLTLDLDIGFADFLAAWDGGPLPDPNLGFANLRAAGNNKPFLLGLEVTDANGVADLYVAALAPPTQVPEPPTLVLLSLPLLGLLLTAPSRRRNLAQRVRSAAHLVVGLPAESSPRASALTALRCDDRRQQPGLRLPPGRGLHFVGIRTPCAHRVRGHAEALLERAGERGRMGEPQLVRQLLEAQLRGMGGRDGLQCPAQPAVQDEGRHAAQRLEQPVQRGPRETERLEQIVRPEIGAAQVGLDEVCQVGQ